MYAGHSFRIGASYKAVAGDVMTVKHYNTFRALHVIFRALSTSVWQKSGRFYIVSRACLTSLVRRARETRLYSDL